MSNVIDVIAPRPDGRQIPVAKDRNRRHAALVRVFVCQAFNIPPDAIASRHRGSRPVCNARQIAMYLTHVVFSVPLTHVAAAFGRDRSTAYHACRVVELKRDDAAFDRLLCHLEWHLCAAARGAL